MSLSSTKTMKLLYIHNHFYNQQRANFIQVLNMCNAFSKEGIDVSLAVFNPDMNMIAFKKDIREKFDISENFKIIAIPYASKKYHSINFSGFAVRRIIKQEMPDICYFREMINLFCFWDGNFRFVAEVHNNQLHHNKWLDMLWRKILVSFSNKKSCRYLVTISDALKRYWADLGFNKEKLLSFHDGFNPEQFKKLLSKKEARQRLNLPVDMKIIVYTGSLYPDREIENIFRLAKIFPKHKFVIVGGPEKNKAYYEKMALSKKLLNIDLVGRVYHKQIPLFLYSADVLLAIWSKKVPTINYCSPLKIFEYMAAGRIIVAHGFPTIKEVLADNKTALLASPDSFDDLVDKVRIALSKRYPSKMAQEARVTAFEKYTWDKRAKDILSFLS